MSGAVTLQLWIDTKDCTARLDRMTSLYPLMSQEQVDAVAAWMESPASAICIEWDGTTARTVFVPDFVALLDEIEAVCAAKAAAADLGGGV